MEETLVLEKEARMPSRQKVIPIQLIEIAKYKLPFCCCPGCLFLKLLDRTKPYVSLNFEIGRCVGLFPVT